FLILARTWFAFGLPSKTRCDRPQAITSSTHSSANWLPWRIMEHQGNDGVNSSQSSPFFHNDQWTYMLETSKETHSPLPQVGSKQKKDRVICSMFLNVSKDPITGVSQPSGGYYKRNFEYFDARMWMGIQKAINSFTGCKSLVDRRNESGKTERGR
ncbi:hypothetical protein ACJX0J_012840, partial [Zea mays]